MPYLSTMERMAKQEGIEEGLQQGCLRQLLRQLRWRFESVPESVENSLKNCNVEQLEELMDVALTVDSLAEFVSSIPGENAD